MADWTQRGSVLTAADASSAKDYGWRTGTSADGLAMAVSAHFWKTANSTAGIYTYDWSSGAWSQRGSVLAEDTTDGSGGAYINYGTFVALNSDGSVMAVGAANDPPNTSNNYGAVYIYDRSGSSWVQRGSLVVPGTRISLNSFGLGGALSADGLVLLVSSFSKVYRFEWSGSAWVENGTILAVGATALATNDDGSCMALSRSINDFGSPGEFRVYDWTGSAWSQKGSTATLSTQNFGDAIAMNSDGTRVFVGATGGNGSVRPYDWSGSAWNAGTTITAPDAATNDRFGAVSCDSAATILNVGALGWEGSITNQGGIYTFDYTPPPSGSGAISILPTVAGAGDYTNASGSTGTGAVTIYPAVAGAGTFPTVFGSGSVTIRPTVAGAARIDVAWTASVSSAPSTAQAAFHAYEISWSASVSSAPSEVDAEAWAGTLEMPSIGIGYAAQGAERTDVASITIACEIGGTAYPAQWLTIRKRLANSDGTASYGAETADVAIPYTRAVFAALLAAVQAGETLSLSARYVLNSGAAYVRPLGEFDLTNVKRSSNGATVVATGERFPVYAVSDDPVELAGSCYETARSVRCAVDHQVYPGQAVQGHAAAFVCDAVTITLDAPQASSIMEVFARG